MGSLLQLVVNLLPELLECLPASDLLRQLVIQRGQAPFLDRLHGDAKHDLLAGQIFLGVVRRKRQGDVAGLAGGLPDESFGQARDQALLIDLELCVGLAFADQDGAGFEDMSVHCQKIARLNRSLRGMQFGEAQAQPLESLIDLLVADLGARMGNADVLVVLQRDVGLDRNGGGKAHRLAPLELLHLDPRHIDRIEGGFVEGRVVGGWQDQVKGLLAQCGPADFPFDHRSGRFAGPEAGDAHAGRQPAVRLVDRL